MNTQVEETKPIRSRKAERALWITVIVLLITVGALGWLIKKKNFTIVEQTINMKALTDTVKIGKDKEGNNTAKIASFQTAKVRDFLKIQSQNKEIKRLQAVVLQNRDRLGNSGTVTIFDSSTKAVGTVKTEVVPGKITFSPSKDISKPDTVNKWPIYKASLTLGKWVNANVVASRDSTTINVGLYNEYSIINGEDVLKKGFLGIGKKTTPFVEVTNYNPYSTNSVVRSYSVKQAPIKKNWLYAGPGVNVDLKGNVNVGASVGINLLEVFRK